ncbi:MAG: type II toxin-antitoxin system Phd/YefM family antitoxin [Myxococcales bacterium]|nr:type II toxin-antitoxin system Phd/YefM family antitoxin [Myxococcales bacterium]
MTVTVRELKNRLSEYLRRVQQGEPLVVTDHGRPIARVEVVQADKLSPEERLALMVEAGEISQPKKRGRLKWTKPSRIRGRPISETLLEDRG